MTTRAYPHLPAHLQPPNSPSPAPSAASYRTAPLRNTSTPSPGLPTPSPRVSGVTLTPELFLPHAITPAQNTPPVHNIRHSAQLPGYKPELTDGVMSSSTIDQANGPPRGPPKGPPVGPPDLSDKYYKPKTLAFWLIMISNFVAIFLVALDRTILSTAIPQISDTFKTQEDIGWYGSAYMLTTAASQLVFGRIFKFYNVKITYLICIIIFEAGSALCGAAPSSVLFIIGRAIAGIGSAGIFSGSMMIMIPMLPLPKRPMFQSIFGMVFGLSSVIGPLVGGGFTESSLTWRWCFYINLPVGGVAFVLLCFFLDNRATPGPKAPVSAWGHIIRLDPLGTLFFVPAIVSLLLALQWGGSSYAWKSWRIILLFVVFAVGMFAFGAVQVFMPKTATVPVRVIKNRSMFCGALFMLFLAGGMMMAIYYVPMWFQTVKRVDAVQSGIFSIPLVLSIVVSSIISGVSISKIGYYVPSMLLCPAIMAVGEGMLSTLKVNSGHSHWIAFEFLTGFGLGFGMQVVNLAAQTVLAPADVSTGIAIAFFSQQLGAAIFVSVGETILSNLLATKLSGIPGIGGSVTVSEGATSLYELVPEEYHPQVKAAYNYACTKVFFAGAILCIACFICALGMEWKNLSVVHNERKKEAMGEGPEVDKDEVQMEEAHVRPASESGAMTERRDHTNTDQPPRY